MSCPEQATARRMGSIGFQPVLFTLSSDAFPAACNLSIKLRVEPWVAGDVPLGRRQAGSPSYFRPSRSATYVLFSRDS
jgi:hypothetical protein